MKRDQVPLAQIRKAAAANASQIPYILGQKVRINKENHKGKGKAERRGRMKSAAKRRKGKSKKVRKVKVREQAMQCEI